MEIVMKCHRIGDPCFSFTDWVNSIVHKAETWIKQVESMHGHSAQKLTECIDLCVCVYIYMCIVYLYSVYINWQNVTIS